jgi:small-conductance mechanosensitive channel
MTSPKIERLVAASSLMSVSILKGINLSDLISDDLLKRAAVWGSKFGMSLLLFLGFFLASVIAEKLIRRIGHRADPMKQDVLKLIGQIAKITLIVLGAVTSLGTMGVNVSALVAGLGLTGFALGFAFKDALSNILAGVMILVYRPFHHGDQISVAGFEGRVTGVDLRYTMLQADRKRFLIPNSILLTNALIVNEAKEVEASLDSDQDHATVRS